VRYVWSEYRINAILTTPLLKAKENTIEIVDFDEHAVKAMWVHIYTGETSDLHKLASDLLAIADKYDLKGEFGSSLSALALADLHNASILKTEVTARRFIKRNMGYGKEDKGIPGGCQGQSISPRFLYFLN